MPNICKAELYPSPAVFIFVNNTIPAWTCLISSNFRRWAVLVSYWRTDHLGIPGAVLGENSILLAEGRHYLDTVTPVLLLTGWRGAFSRRWEWYDCSQWYRFSGHMGGKFGWLYIFCLAPVGEDAVYASHGPLFSPWEVEIDKHTQRRTSLRTLRQLC